MQNPQELREITVAQIEAFADAPDDEMAQTPLAQARRLQLPRPLPETNRCLVLNLAHHIPPSNLFTARVKTRSSLLTLAPART